MAKKIIFFLIVAFLCCTTNAFACEIKTEQCCCKMEKNTTSKKDCCKKMAQKTAESKNCKGKCGHAGCNVPAVQLLVILPFVTEINFNPLFKSSGKVKFYDFKTAISSGFKSIWLPPVIT